MNVLMLLCSRKTKPQFTPLYVWKRRNNLYKRAAYLLSCHSQNIEDGFILLVRQCLRLRTRAYQLNVSVYA